MIHALLDDRDASPERPTSRLYTGFRREHRIEDPARLGEAWAEVDADLRAGLQAVLLADYEWGAKLLHAGDDALPAGDGAALRVMMFERLQRLSRAEVDVWLRAMDEDAEAPGAAGVMQLAESVERDEFIAAIDRIHEAIRAGETYQVNYTYRMSGQAYGRPSSLYRRLRARQPVAYGAWIALPDGRQILSCSPELFLRHDAGLLTARPMKGTASRIRQAEGDSETARLLFHDIKNRAENLMIVDLLRNDIGRVAETGSVRVPALFAIEPYATVFQMTSTVQARLATGVDMPALLRAVFPCGSITGAPKHHTMGLIAALESTPRGLYTGSIGWLDAPAEGRAVGDFCFSVAIRTLTLGPERGGLRPARLGIGAGIVLDSRAADEFEECRLKARFLTGLDPGFALFETMHAEPTHGVRHLDRHLARLAASAAALGFVWDEAGAWRRIDAQLATLAADAGPQRLRLALAHDGGLQCTSAALTPLPEGPVSLLLASEPLPDADPLAAHKTTRRALYDAGLRAAEAQGAFDTLYFGADDRLIEGGRSNVFLKLDGRWFTPPVADGALPGVMRGVLLERGLPVRVAAQATRAMSEARPAAAPDATRGAMAEAMPDAMRGVLQGDAPESAEERRLTRADLARAEAIVVCNALRGALSAVLMGDAQGQAERDVEGHAGRSTSGRGADVGTHDAEGRRRARGTP